MADEYTLFKLNLSGVVDTAEIHRLDCDDSALLRAKSIGHIYSVEVFAGKRRVGVIPAGRSKRT